MFHIYVQYCTISKYLAGGVTWDRLDEFRPPAKDIGTWDRHQILATGAISAKIPCVLKALI